jgi:hypothetical protein
MTARQPQSMNEAIMLGQMMPNQPRGIFGGMRRRPGLLGGGNFASPYAAPQVDAPPPITAAPPPPTDWADQLGPETLGNLPQIDPYASQGFGAGSGVGGQNATVAPLDAQGLPPAPPMRGGTLGNRGMFGGERVPLGTLGAPPSPAALAAGAGSALQRGGNTLADTAADAMPKKKGFDWRMAAGILGDALAGLNGQQPLYAQAMYKERQARADQQRQLAEITLRSRLDAAKPDYFTAGNDRVRYDPTTGTSETLYTAPEEFDTYARSLGAEPGTEEYRRLAQDYVLKTGGPTATDLNMEEEDHRQDNRVAYEGVRQTNREKLAGQRLNNSLTLRQSPTYSQRHPKPSKPAGRGGGGVREGQTATGPGGAKMVYRGGKWVPTK